MRLPVLKSLSVFIVCIFLCSQIPFSFGARPVDNVKEEALTHTVKTKIYSRLNDNSVFTKALEKMEGVKCNPIKFKDPYGNEYNALELELDPEKANCKKIDDALLGTGFYQYLDAPPETTLKTDDFEVIIRTGKYYYTPGEKVDIIVELRCEDPDKIFTGKGAKTTRCKIEGPEFLKAPEETNIDDEMSIVHIMTFSCDMDKNAKEGAYSAKVTFGFEMKGKGLRKAFKVESPVLFGVSAIQIVPQNQIRRSMPAGYIGVKQPDPIPDDATDGVEIGEVMKDTPAEKIGLQKGDKIIKIDNKQFKTFQELAQYVGGKKPGELIKLGTLRGNEEKVYSLRLGTRPENIFE